MAFKQLRQREISLVQAWLTTVQGAMDIKDGMAPQILVVPSAGALDAMDIKDGNSALTHGSVRTARLSRGTWGEIFFSRSFFYSCVDTQGTLGRASK